MSLLDADENPTKPRARLLAIKEACGDHLDAVHMTRALISAESLDSGGGAHHTPLFSARWTSEADQQRKRDFRGDHMGKRDFKGARGQGGKD